MSLPGRRRKVTNAILVYVLLLLTLQIFLVTVAAEGLLDGDAALAWSATSISAVLALIAALFYRYLR
ncbi:MAG: DUF6755 family protein [Acidimicrobiia bacterium]